MIWWLSGAPWLVFIAWWKVRAAKVAPDRHRESARSRLGYGALMVAGALLIALPLPPALTYFVLPPSTARVVLGLSLEVAGIAFAIWARETLGRYWSGRITLKEGHRLIRTGPYALARHPIYTGVLTGMLGVALVRGQAASLLALLFFAAAIARKIAIEERLLAAHFGDEYAQYRARVKMLVPFVL